MWFYFTLKGIKQDFDYTVFICHEQKTPLFNRLIWTWPQCPQLVNQLIFWQLTVKFPQKQNCHKNRAIKGLKSMDSSTLLWFEHLCLFRPGTTVSKLTLLPGKNKQLNALTMTKYGNPCVTACFFWRFLFVMSEGADGPCTDFGNKHQEQRGDDEERGRLNLPHPPSPMHSWQSQTPVWRWLQ